MHLHFQAMELQNERGHNYTVPKPSGEPVRLLSGFGVLLNYTAFKPLTKVKANSHFEY